MFADSERLRQALLNLVGNAVKFTDAGQVTIKACFRREDGGRIRFEVIDTGVGVPAGDEGRLFQRFSKVDGSNTRRYGGTGLGLAIAKRLVELMGGAIGYEAGRSQGSIFWFDIPASVAAAPHQRSAEPDVASGVEGLRVLIVDDVLTNRELVGALLAPFDVAVLQAADGAEAVELAARHPFDVILMDLQMPVMDGLAATRLIRSGSPLNSETPILAVSANAMPPQVEACRAAGMNDHIAKPINPTDLIGKIDRWALSAGGSDTA